MAVNPKGATRAMDRSMLRAKLIDSRLLVGQKIAVAGSRKGIGFECAYAALCAGATVALNTRGPEFSQENLAALQEFDGRWSVIEADISQQEQPERFVDEAWETMDGIRVLLNNVGIWRAYDPAADFDYQTFQQLSNTNVRGAMAASHRFVQKSLELSADTRWDKPQKVVSTGSINGDCSEHGHIWYDPTKGAVRSFTRSAGLHHSRNSILFHQLEPGLVLTDAIRDELQQAEMDLKSERTPLGRLATTAEVAAAFVWLACDLNNFNTGGTTVVNGGVGISQFGGDMDC